MKNMKISFSKPPIYKEACELFGIKDGDPVIFTFGSIIFNPSNVNLTPDLMAHEAVHGRQQQMDPDVANVWWKRYLADPAFRIEQEVEAYATQYAVLCGKIKDRNTRARILFQLASHLSGTIYGSAISHSEAMKKIRIRS